MELPDRCIWCWRQAYGKVGWKWHNVFLRSGEASYKLAWLASAEIDLLPEMDMACQQRIHALRHDSWIELREELLQRLIASIQPFPLRPFLRGYAEDRIMVYGECKARSRAKSGQLTPSVPIFGDARIVGHVRGRARMRQIHHNNLRALPE